VKRPPEGEPPEGEPPEGEPPDGEPRDGGAHAPASPRRLDPDLAIATGGDEPPEPQRTEPIDTRPYRWAIGIFGLVLVVAISVYQFAKNGVGGPGVAPGHRLHLFVAPLATGSLNLDANMNPHCDPAHPNPQGLNVCGRTPLVLAFFVTGSASCARQVDAMQTLSRRYPPQRVQFAAVAIKAGKQSTAAEVRAHHWTIPVAYDRDGAVGQTYGVEICPIIELARRGAVVEQRLIGEHWSTVAALAGPVRALAAKR
jgi:peroxiredoxin